jgi:hemoglobin
MDSLYDAIGGLPALEVAVQQFCERVRMDTEVSAFFAGMDLHQQKSHLIAYLGQAVGGPTRYTGASMRRARAQAQIGQREFDVVANHLTATLQELGVGDDLVEAVMNRVRPLSAHIVNSGVVKAAAA